MIKNASGLLAAAMSVTAIVIAGFATAAPSQDTPAKAGNASATTPLSRGPIAVYDGACARCHGPNGSFYGPTLGQGKTDEELRKVIQDMADGPGNETLTPAELDSQTSYHRALIRKEPFVAVIARNGDKIEGEVTSSATVSVRRKDANTAPNAEQTAKVDGSHWSVSVPGINASDALIVTAHLDKTDVSIDTSRQLWSHTDPLPAPKK